MILNRIAHTEQVFGDLLRYQGVGAANSSSACSVAACFPTEYPMARYPRMRFSNIRANMGTSGSWERQRALHRNRSLGTRPLRAACTGPAVLKPRRSTGSSRITSTSSARCTTNGRRVVIFVDSNVPMYLDGASHPNKDAAIRLLEQVISRGQRLVTDAAVLQEILHRHRAIRRPDAIQPAFDALLGVVDDVHPIEQKDVQQAKMIMLGVVVLSARDAVHPAVMRRRDVSRVMSFDAVFDEVGWVERLS